MKSKQPVNVAVGSGRLVLLRVPNKRYSTGLCEWEFGTAIRWDSWNHAASHWMRGPCPNCGSPTSTYGGGWSCHNDYCPTSADNFACSSGPAPKWWETQINVFRDGDAWCATEDGFVNLQESRAGFGKTPDEAVTELMQNTRIEP